VKEVPVIFNPVACITPSFDTEKTSIVALLPLIIFPLELDIFAPMPLELDIFAPMPLELDIFAPMPLTLEHSNPLSFCENALMPASLTQLTISPISFADPAVSDFTLRSHIPSLVVALVTLFGPAAPVSPRGIVKLNTAALVVPLFVTLALVPALPVVVVPTVTVAAAPRAPLGSSVMTFTGDSLSM
jgi:hypothetical protein